MNFHIFIYTNVDIYPNILSSAPNPNEGEANPNILSSAPNPNPEFYSYIYLNLILYISVR
jgi:hypothetical protein